MTEGSILVTGATGTVGSEVVKQLSVKIIMLLETLFATKQSCLKPTHYYELATFPWDIVQTRQIS
jgi:hypothetical protein